MTRVAHILSLLGFLTAVAAWQLHPLLYKGFYYHAIAVSFALLFSSLYLQSRGGWSLIHLIMFGVSLNNIVDEAISNPLVNDLAEWFTFIGIVLVVYARRNYYTRE